MTPRLLRCRAARFMRTGLGVAGSFGLSVAAIGQAPDFSEIVPLFDEHCADCHSDPDDADGHLLLRTHEEVLKGGESGAVVRAGNAQESLLVEYIEGRVNKPGRKKIMPPGNRAKLGPDQIGAIRAWIDAGAKHPAVAVKPKELKVPRIEPLRPPRVPIAALATSAPGSLLAAARGSGIELRQAPSSAVDRRLDVSMGPIASATFSRDGRLLVAAGGQPGLAGEVTIWDVSTGNVLHRWRAHDDAIHGLALSPDGALLATGSYDQQIKIWNASTAAEIRTLKGHNGAVFGLAFRPDGAILASASADRTIKLWDVQSGERRDTLSQPLKEQKAVAWIDGGSRLIAVGADSRLRIWSVSPEARETTNPLLESIFAHEGSILALAVAGDGSHALTAGSEGGVKLWQLPAGRLLREIEKQADWPQSVAFFGNKIISVGRADGSLVHYTAATGEPIKPPAPVIRRIDPPVVQRGVRTTVRIVGEKLVELTTVGSSDPRLHAKLLSARSTDSAASVEFSPDPHLPRGTYQVWLSNAGGDSAKLSLHVENLPVVRASAQQTRLDHTPANVWSTFDRAMEAREMSFEAGAGQLFVFDVRAAEFGSKAEPEFTLLDPAGRTLANNPRHFRFPGAGTHRLRFTEKTMAASPDHFFSLTVGDFPLVTGVSPLVLRQGRDGSVTLLGQNVPPARVEVDTTRAGEVGVPMDPEKLRWTRELKVLVTADPVVAEADFVLDRTGGPAELRFPARAGHALVVESIAARRGSPADTVIEVRWPDGRPVESVRLQAMRQTQQAFRGINSVQDTDFRVDQWEEMELRQFLYCNGEVVRLYRAPEGPDSGFVVFARNGMRRTYFNTSSSAHSLEETYYVVRPLEPGEPPSPNGLPVFTLHCRNDDDPERELGSDSRVIFQPPRDGEFIARLSDSRGFAGPDFAAHVRVREARPGFTVSISGAEAPVTPGAGLAFEAVIDRVDGFEGPVRIEFEHVPDGFSLTSPLGIEDDHLVASGTIFAAADAKTPPADQPITFTATARIGDQDVRMPGTWGVPRLKDGAKPPFKLSVKPDEITIAPGTIVPARLEVERLGNDGILNLEVLNLPHGVIVNNIGLNGVQIAQGENGRDIEFACERWVADADRPAFPAVKGGTGQQTGPAISFRVRRAAP